jgi:magnesium transporter
MADDQQNQQDNLIDAVVRDIATEDTTALEDRVAQLHPAEAADLLESLPRSGRDAVWACVPEDRRGEVLIEMGEEARGALIETMAPEDVAEVTEAMEPVYVAEVVDALPEEVGDAIRESLDPEQRQQVDATLAWPEGSAGRIMHVDAVSVRADVSLEVVSRYLRRRKSVPKNSDGLMVIDRDGTYLGKLGFGTLLTADPEATVGEAMDRVQAVDVCMDQHEVAALFERRDLLSVAVIDAAGKLLGRIAVDDIVDVIRAQADAQVLAMAGLEEGEDLFAPVVPSARRRAVWLGINLLTAFLASWVIGLFEATLEQIVALAVLMPIVASMGGITGSQTLTLAIRGLALGQVSAANRRWLTTKELAVGFLNGLLWAVVVAAVAVVWFEDLGIGAVIAAALIVNMGVAALAGVLVPLILARFGIDPAISGSVVLTTVTDVVGFMSFLGLATLFLL